MLTLIWRERALEEFESILDYISARNRPAAERLKSEAQSCAEVLREHPFMHRAGRVEGTREAVIHPNYIMVYRVTAEAVEIVALVHARREYP